MGYKAVARIKRGQKQIESITRGYNWLPKVTMG